MKLEKKELLSGGGAILSAIANLKSIFDNAEIWIIIVCSILFVFFFVTFLILRLRDRFLVVNRRLDRDKVRPEFTYFKNLDTHVVIDLDDNYIDAKFTYKRRVECMKSGANIYNYFFTPISKFNNFRVNIGLVSIKDIEGAADITHTLDKPYSKGDELDLELSFNANDLFENSSNFWILPKAYGGREAVKIEIRFPRQSEILFHNGDIIVNSIKRERIPLRKQPYKDFQNNRLVLIVETLANELQVGDKLSTNWIYDKEAVSSISS